MPSVNIQLNSGSDAQFLPGDYVEGDIIVTSSSATGDSNISVSSSSDNNCGMQGNHHTGFRQRNMFESDNNCGMQGNHHTGFRQRNMFEIKSKIMEDRSIKPGVTKFPFAVRIPNRPLCPPFKTRRIEVRYTLQGIITSPFSYLSWVDRKSTSSLLFLEICQPLEAIEDHQHDQIVSDTVEKQVGEWGTDSLTLQNRLKYVFGVDVAKTWTSIVAKCTSPATILLYRDEPYYLQNDFRLTLAIPQEPDIKLEAPVTIENLEICIITTILLKLVPKLEVIKLSVFRARGTYSALESGTPSGSVTDVTSLISGAKILEDVRPSIVSPEMDVVNKLSVNFALRTENRAGVKQPSAKFSFELPLTILRTKGSANSS